MIKSKLLSKLFLSFSTLALIVGPLAFFKDSNKTAAVDDYTAVLSSRNQSVHRGETFNVDLELSANTGITTLFVALKFDHRTFTLRDVIQQKEALSQHNLEYSGSGFDYVDDLTGGFNLFWDGPKADDTNGKIATLTFETSMIANLGPSEITFEIVQKNTTAAYDVPAFVRVFSPTIEVKEGKYIVIWNDYNGQPVRNDKLTDHPYNDVFKGYEFASESTLDKDRDFPSDLLKEEDDEYSYQFKGWVGDVYRGTAAIPADTSILCYRASYTLIPKMYNVYFYVDGILPVDADPEDINDPDGIITDEEFFTGIEVPFGGLIDLEIAPHQEKLTFYGWYEDELFTKKVINSKMPAHNVTLYGYFKPNLRELNVPIIEMVYRETKTEQINNVWKDIAYIDVYLTNNTGLNSMVLTLDQYNTDAIQFIGFDWGDVFADAIRDNTAVIDNNYNVDNFKFYWERISETVNNYENGIILTLMFNVNNEYDAGLYEVGLTYNEYHDATYFNEDSEIWYTKLDIRKAEIPIGKRSSWLEPIPNSNKYIEVDIDVDVPYNVRLVIEDVFDEKDEIIDKEELENKLNENFEVHDLYDIYYVINGQRTSYDFSRTVTISLSDELANAREVDVYYVDNDGKLILQNSRVFEKDLDGDGQAEKCIRFVVDHFSNWAIVGDRRPVVVTSGMSENQKMTQIMLILFAIVASALIAMLIAKNRHKFRLINLSKKEEMSK